MKLSPDQSENTPPNPGRPSTMDKWKTLMEDTHLLQQALHITLQVKHICSLCACVCRASSQFGMWACEPHRPFPPVTLSSCSTKPSSILSKSLHQEPTPWVRYAKTPSSLTAFDTLWRPLSVCWNNTGGARVFCWCRVPLGEPRAGQGRVWRSLAQAADIYILPKHLDDLKYSNWAELCISDCL